MFDNDVPPPITIRWMRPQNSSAYLDLPSAPIQAPSSRGAAWQAFTEAESAACEEAWNQLTDDEQWEAMKGQGSITEDIDAKERFVTDEDEDGDTVGVAVTQDRLFEVDVRVLQLKPIYWSMNAPPIHVMRATWMYDENRPVMEYMSWQLEEAYRALRPWYSTYASDLTTALGKGPEGHDQLKYPIDDKSSVLFHDAHSGRIILNNLSSRFFASLRATKPESRITALSTGFFPGSTLVYRGYEAAVVAKNPPKLNPAEELPKAEVSEALLSPPAAPLLPSPPTAPEAAPKSEVEIPEDVGDRPTTEERIGSPTPSNRPTSPPLDGRPGSPLSTGGGDQSPDPNSLDDTGSGPPKRGTGKVGKGGRGGPSSGGGGGAGRGRSGANSSGHQPTQSMDNKEKGISRGDGAKKKKDHEEKKAPEVATLVEAPLVPEAAVPPKPVVQKKHKERAPSIDTTTLAPRSEVGDNITDLILVIHGIGQGLAEPSEHSNFVYSTNLLRQVARKQSTSPALASIKRNRRIQFLPVQWRANFHLNSDEVGGREHDGLDNDFTLADITPKNSAPFARDLMNKVLIDIPYFMSHHRQGMIDSVAKQTNRIYRLWCARNPNFEENGRVHIIAHSLGAALAAHILSEQPTRVRECSKVEAVPPGFFAFDTSSLFMLGSPFPLFLHISRAPVIARKGRERTMKSQSDEALDRGGLGCLAVDSVYNIFHPSDPVSYLLNPCVDAKKAKDLPPSPIRNTSTPIASHIPMRMARMFDSMSNPFSPIRSPMSPTAGRATGGFDLKGPAERSDGTRSERRFAALNPHGTLDFVLPSDGSSGEYADMITAHSSYWADQNLAAFIQAEILAKKEDLARTGIGLEYSPSTPTRRRLHM